MKTFILRRFGNLTKLLHIAYGSRMNSVAKMKNLLKQVDLAPYNVFLTRFSSQAANSFADIELPNALILLTLATVAQLTLAGCVAVPAAGPLSASTPASTPISTPTPAPQPVSTSTPAPAPPPTSTSIPVPLPTATLAPPTPLAAWPTNGWPTSSPAQQGLDEAMLAKIFERIEQDKLKIHSPLDETQLWRLVEDFIIPAQVD